MKCRQAGIWMDVALDGASEGRLPEQPAGLPAGWRNLLEAHLAGCPQCRSQWEALRFAENALRAPRPAPVPEGLLLDFRQRLAQENAPSRLESGGRQRSIWAWLWPTGSLAAAGLATAFVLTFGPNLLRHGGEETAARPAPEVAAVAPSGGEAAPPPDAAPAERSVERLAMSGNRSQATGSVSQKSLESSPAAIAGNPGSGSPPVASAGPATPPLGTAESGGTLGAAPGSAGSPGLAFAPGAPVPPMEGARSGSGSATAAGTAGEGTRVVHPSKGGGTPEPAPAEKGGPGGYSGFVAAKGGPRPDAVAPVGAAPQVAMGPSQVLNVVERETGARYMMAEDSVQLENAAGEAVWAFRVQALPADYQVSPALLTALNRTVEVRLVDVPVDQAARQLALTADVALVLDVKDFSSSITSAEGQVPLWRALESVAKQADLRIYPEENRLVLRGVVAALAEVAPEALVQRQSRGAAPAAPGGRGVAPLARARPGALARQQADYQPDLRYWASEWGNLPRRGFTAPGPEDLPALFLGTGLPAAPVTNRGPELGDEGANPYNLRLPILEPTRRR